mgnify:CR=1 FL=1
MIHKMDKRQQTITSEREMGFEEDRMNKNRTGIEIQPFVKRSDETSEA